jgi:AcrR family transcriptional regulator
VGTLTQKKAMKRQRLLDAAYDLFQTKGADGTTIDEIARRAQVAKGTFYLYFRDKKAILDTLVFDICHKVFRDACENMDEHRADNLAENVIHVVDYVIDYFKRDPLTLSVLCRNFGWRPVLEVELGKSDDPLLQHLLLALRNSPEMQGRTEAEVVNLVYVLMEMVGSVCYASIIEHAPDNIDNMKPVLYEVIRKSLC